MFYVAAKRKGAGPLRRASRGLPGLSMSALFDPAIRQALVKEAMASDAHRALINFMNLENAVCGSPKYATEESKATALREIYRPSAAKFDAAQGQARANSHRRCGLQLE